MSIADDIDRLAAQRDAGHLNEAEFEAAKAKLFAQETPRAIGFDASAAGAADASSLNRLRRSATDRWIGGVCGGIATLTGVESWIVRLLFVIAILFGGFGLIPYLLLWIFVPPER